MTTERRNQELNVKLCQLQLKLTSVSLSLGKHMRTKFCGNLASFDSIDKKRLPPLSDSGKIYHICRDKLISNTRRVQPCLGRHL